MKWLIGLVLAGCGGAQWTDTFTGKDVRSIPDASSFESAIETDDGGSSAAECAELATFKPPVATITVTFPNYDTPNVTVHVVTPNATCDMPAEATDTNILFVSDASACALILAPGNPSSSNATASGPNDLLFVWNYGDFCQVQDDYALSKQ